MLDDRWPNSVKSSRNHHHHESPSYRSHSIDTAADRSPIHYQNNNRLGYHRHDYPVCGVSPRYSSNYYPPSSSHHHQSHQQRSQPEMLRSRQFPEIAGIASDEQPTLRRFTRYNQSINTNLKSDSHRMELIDEAKRTTNSNGGSVFAKSMKKPLFFMGNWTFRDKNKPSRPSINTVIREERPMSINLSDVRTSRSKSGDATVSRTSIIIGDERHPNEFPRHVETRIPVRIERSSMIRQKPCSLNSSSSSSASSPSQEYKTSIAVMNEPDEPVIRPRKDSNQYSFQSCVHLRKSCPDLDTSSLRNTENMRVSKKRTRRAKEKMASAAWRKKPVKDWTLDDVILWLQSVQMDDVASLLIGYDLTGEDLLLWDDDTLTRLGVSDSSTRSLLLKSLRDTIEKGPETKISTASNNSQRALFEIVKQSSYDQVVAVETPLTTRDITVTHGRLGCLQITKVNGCNLPLKENDCLLEINECAGDQFKSALMLTKLITDSNGMPIRFVVLRKKTDCGSEEPSKESSSSGISSTPHTPLA
ncbi:unnamed protein product [Caenorhabditis bovis]|uniref:SAM domain-containing protein n=1 Tax=Caenorhabditis bovis TaxID=2654633 RepID=A0A8S1ELF5_9PELO|nr:unnamed protein product [Caenorhabditis bovis]